MEARRMNFRFLKSNDHKGVFSLFGYAERKYVTISAWSAGLIVALTLPGCGGDQSRDESDTQYYTDQSSSVFAPDPQGRDPWSGSTQPDDDRPVWELGDRGGAAVSEPDQGGTPAPSDPIGGWSIVLTKLASGDLRRDQELLRVIQEEAGLRQAFIEQRNEGLVIAYGNYLGRDAAQKDLERVRATRLMGTTPFENAIVTPPSSAELRGSNPSWDLRNARKRYGKQAVYTLQVGVYGRADYQTPKADELAEFRKAAEAAVRDLRGQGDLAFYYHSPARSMVTVGVFGEKDFDSTVRPPYQSPTLRAVREKFPNNLLNGQGINETIRTESGKVTRMQSSQLVAIPES